ncbi:MAG: hypothetical protein JXX29_19410 [Deltaproteobacteria bacterium]|nr:hypothetical protein [Deltaproteobacteria bacterium]MBN2673857.1 hypothetical protein [Deltaproteobacteria bacterium]
MGLCRQGLKDEIGSVQVEQLVLLAMVAIGFSAATVTLGPVLMSYHYGIEFLLSLPVP